MEWMRWGGRCWLCAVKMICFGRIRIGRGGEGGAQMMKTVQ